MTSFQQYVGLLRSVVMYHGIPFRKRRMSRFYAQFIRTGDLCFDVGAHVGSRLSVWSRLGARVVGVEPQPQCMRWLERWYGHDRSLILVEEAVGATPGRGTLLVSQRTPTVTTLSQDWIEAVRRTPSFARVRWDERFPVTMTTLDDLIGRYGKPAFCKIDVEGYELDVLRGLSRPIPALSFEYVVAAKDAALACVERLEQLGEYEYNWSPGESHRLQAETWLSAEEMLTYLRSLSTEEGSGDVYARLIGSKLDSSREGDESLDPMQKLALGGRAGG